MITFFLVILAVFDAAILYLFLSQKDKDGVDSELLNEIAEERRGINELVATVRSQCQSTIAENRKILQEVTKYAAEIEQELKHSKDTIGEHMSEIIAELSQQVDRPLVELTKKQNSLEVLLRKVSSERQRSAKVLEKAEKICRFFNEQVPYEDLLKDIEYKKYEDARKMLVKGHSQSQVASDLGLSLAEVQLVHGVTSA